jgi:hypothetical protein
MGTTLNDSIVKPIIDALAIEASRIVDLEPHFILWGEREEARDGLVGSGLMKLCQQRELGIGRSFGG